jgi:hypothetical protein
MMGTLRGMLTKNPAEKILMESHKRGGPVGSKQKKAMGGDMGANSVMSGKGYKKGGPCRKKRAMGGEMDPAMIKDTITEKPMVNGPRTPRPMGRPMPSLGRAQRPMGPS